MLPEEGKGKGKGQEPFLWGGGGKKVSKGENKLP